MYTQTTTETTSAPATAMMIPVEALHLHMFCADNDSGREVIKYVQVVNDHGKCTAVAVNGHHLAIYKWSSPEIDARVELYLDHEACKVAAKGKAEIQRHATPSGIVSGNINATFVSFESRGLTYPDWQQVLPKTDPAPEAPATFGFSAEYVGTLAKYLKACKVVPQIQLVTYPGKDGLGPLVFKSPDPLFDLTYVLMPARV